MTIDTSPEAVAKMQEGVTPQRQRLDLWSAENPRDALAIAAITAWANCPPDKMPASWIGHTCQATKEAWGRVVEVVAREAVPALAAQLAAERAAHAETRADMRAAIADRDDYEAWWLEAKTRAEAAKAENARLRDAGLRALALLRADGRGDTDIAMSLADALQETQP